MSTGWRHAESASVEDERTEMALLLTVSSTAEPIAGKVREAGGRERPFTGWLGLLSEIRSVLGLTVPSSRPADGSSHGESGDRDG